MSTGPMDDYKIEPTDRAIEQIHQIAAAVKPDGRLQEFQSILLEAVRRLKTDPHGWGDPAFHKSVGGGIQCHGILRPIVIYYVIYDSLRSVILLEVHQFADFE